MARFKRFLPRGEGPAARAGDESAPAEGEPPGFEGEEAAAVPDENARWQGAAEDEEAGGEELAPARAGCGWTLLLILLGTTALVGFGFWAAHEIRMRNIAQPLLESFGGVSMLPASPVRPPDPEQEVRVYYIARDGMLSPQSRLLRGAAGEAARLHQIVRELQAPPSTGLLASPLAGGVEVRGVYLLDGIIYLDLSQTFTRPEEPTPLGERLAIYSLENSFMLNLQSLRGVQILIEGQLAQSAWGWLDISTPLGPDLSLIR